MDFGIIRDVVSGAIGNFIDTSHFYHIADVRLSPESIIPNQSRDSYGAVESERILHWGIR